MNGLQTLYLESILGVTIGALNFNATEFEGHLEMSEIERLCNEGMLSWQNPHAPRGDIAYVVAHFDKDHDYKMAIDTKTNTIVVAIEPPPMRIVHSLSLTEGIQHLDRSQRVANAKVEVFNG